MKVEARRMHATCLWPRVGPARGLGLVNEVMRDVYARPAVTRAINDDCLSPRFAPSQRAWVLTGQLQSISPAIPASAGRDGDDR
jgi:hypothetical protein